ncbi:MAG TPA: AsmA family protein, partial [Steroidobacteraceae bacterium]|nr:AsmA family protein [Steroidobacteraceae bacterium]
QGTGTINDQPFSLQVSGGPLMNLEPDHPYPFDLGIKAGDLQVAASGRMLKPFNLGEVDLGVTLSGQDLAEGFYLTQLALPNTAPFRFHAHVARRDRQIAVTGIAGTMGASDVRGQISIDASTTRPTVKGELTSRELHLRDLAASLGAQPSGSQSLDKHTQPAPSATEPARSLFPDARLQVRRLRAMDADVLFHANSIEAGQIPFKGVSFHIRLNDGILDVDPLALEMQQGRISGQVKVDAREHFPAAHIDLRIAGIQLSQLKGKAPGAEPPLEGLMQARAVIDGKGDSVHRVMSDANGKLTMVLPRGEINAAFAELTGIDVARGLGLLLTKPHDKDEIRCGVAEFAISKGIMTAQNITFDTRNVVIHGSGQIELGPESLDLQIKGDPKKFHLARLRSPIEVRGRLLQPSFGLNAGRTVKQGAVAAALGVVATPLAALIAFVDPGLAKDQNCAQMIAEAESHGPAPPKPGEESRDLRTRQAGSNDSHHLQ